MVKIIDKYCDARGYHNLHSPMLFPYQYHQGVILVQENFVINMQLQKKFKINPMQTFSHLHL